MKPIALLMLFCTGCAPIVGAQVDLVHQARQGLLRLAESVDAREQASDELTRLRRARLDEAFDADVRDQPTLTSQWVIAHRQAYATGLSALQDAQAQARRACQVARDNLAATDAALQRAHWLMQVQLQWDRLIPLPNFKGDLP